MEDDVDPVQENSALALTSICLPSSDCVPLWTTLTMGNCIGIVLICDSLLDYLCYSHFLLCLLAKSVQSSNPCRPGFPLKDRSNFEIIIR